MPNTTSPFPDPRSSETGLKVGLRYPSPFFDIASLFLPPRIKDLFKYCQTYVMTDEIISAAVYKFAQYPITDLIYNTSDGKLKAQWQDILEEKISIRRGLEEYGLDYYTYGNYIASLYIPFARYLICSGCDVKYNIKTIKFSYRPDGRFYAHCPKCSNKPEELVVMRVEDVTIPVIEKINLVRWDPQNIDVEVNPISGNATYYYNIPNHVKRQIAQGRRKILEETPLAFLTAARQNVRVELDPDNIIHVKRPSVSYQDHGWGLPLLVPLLKHRYYMQILMKAREVIAQQHIVPLWVLFPLPTASLDPHSQLSMARWKGQVEDAIRKWRRDPNYIPVFPIPIGFQPIGGDAKAINVIEEIRFAQESLMVGLQAPREFLVGGLQWTGTSVTYRMMENFFMNHVRGLKKLTNFVIQKIARLTKTKPITIDFTKLKWVDDVQQKSILANLNAQGKVSDDSMLTEFGRDAAKELDKMEKEFKKKSDLLVEQAKMQAQQQGEAQIIMQQYQVRAQLEMQKFQRDIVQEYQKYGFTPEQIQQITMSAQLNPAGGQFNPQGILGQEPNKKGLNGGAGGMNVPFSGQTSDQWITQMAQTMMGMDDMQRQQALGNIFKQNPMVHGLVSSRIGELIGVDARPLPEQRPPRRKTQ